MTENKSGIEWGKVVRLGLILFAITAVCSAALAFANAATHTIIEKRNEEANIVARQAVLSEADRFEKIENLEAIASEVNPNEPEAIVEAYAGYKGDEIVGYTVKTNPKGYAGGIEMLTGFKLSDKSIEGITIINQSETPGLGAKAAESNFQDQFKGKDGSQPIKVIKSGAAVDNQVDAITGATITSNAVVNGVNLSEMVFLKLIDAPQKIDSQPEGDEAAQPAEENNDTTEDTKTEPTANTNRMLSGLIVSKNLFSRIVEVVK
jgi:electron transport complex protein RnfG